MNKILIALVLAVVMSGNAFSSENYISTSLNEQMFVQCLKDASPNISQEAMNRCGYEKRSRSHMGVWKKKNPWFNRHFGDIWDWNNFLSMRNSNKSHGFNIILNEMRADGYFLNSFGTYDNKIAFKKLDAIIQVSREIVKKSHKLIVLKGQNAQEDLKKAFNKEKYDYKLENSITNKDSKIILVDFKK